MKQNYIASQEVILSKDTLKEITVDYLTEIRDKLINQQVKESGVKYDGDAWIIQNKPGIWEVWVDDYHPHGGSYNGRCVGKADAFLTHLANVLHYIQL